MVTIPIEVIVQDGPSPEPTPTPSDSGETNIVVPDTGAGTVENGSNGGGIGSATSIILPAIILVLAIGAIVALLIRRQQGRKNNTNTDISKKEKLAATASGTIAILAATVLVGNLVIPTTKAATSVEPGTAELDTVDKITITATREIDSDITVATVKNTSYATANLDFGYKVTASMIEGATTANLYLNGDETSEYYIAPVSDGALADNTWGYTLEEPSEESSYLSIPLEDIPTTIAKGNSEIEDEPVDIYYTIKTDKSLPAGIYTGELEYSLLALEPIETLSYMQDFHTLSEEDKNIITSNMPVGKQYILRDSRDGKSYYISKLADGNVWMTQNLDLNIEAGKIYTSNDTDLNVYGAAGYDQESGYSEDDASISWSPQNSTGSIIIGTNSPESADIGDKYFFASGTSEEDIIFDNIADCVNASHTLAECIHYHAGNYYNFAAAIANGDSYSLESTNQQAPNSICPAGWKLPSAFYNGNNTDNDFYSLFFSANIVSGQIGASQFSYSQNGFHDLRTAPIYMVRSGNGFRLSFRNQGSIGYYASNIAYGELDFNALSFDENNIRTSNNDISKTSGMSVRCLLR